MIKLIKHVNNSSLYIEIQVRIAIVHGYLLVIQPQSLQQQSMPHIYTNRWHYSHDGLIRRCRVLALMVWGPLLPSPIIRTRGGGVRIQQVGAPIWCRCWKRTTFGWLSKPNVRSQPCAIRVRTFITISGPFHYRHALFYTIPALIIRN